MYDFKENINTYLSRIDSAKLNVNDYTSALYNTENENLSVNYEMMKKAAISIDSIYGDTTSVVAGKVLFMDYLGNKIKGFVPQGIEIYPYNEIMCWLGILSLVLFLVGGFWYLAKAMEY